MPRLDRLAEATPIRPTECMLGFATELRCEPPRYLPVMPDESARPDTCLPNVEEAVRRWGGSICHGWILRECPGLWVSARFHAVRLTEGGLFVDETPGLGSEDRQWLLFCRAPLYGPDRDFGQQPAYQRRRIYRSPGRNCHVDPATGREIQAVHSPATATRSFPQRDPLPEAIDAYLTALADAESLFLVSRTGWWCREPERIDYCYEHIARARRRLLRLLEETDESIT